MSRRKGSQSMLRMRTIGLLLAALSVLAAPGAALAYGDAKGPPCADLVAGDSSKSSYSFDGTTHMVTAQLELARPACANITYTFYVVAEDGETVLGRAEGTPAVDANTGAPVVQAFVDLGADGPSTVNTYATTSRAGRVLDRGPDAAFLPLALGAAPAGRGYG
jgi:hypothetical protein